MEIMLIITVSRKLIPLKGTFEGIRGNPRLCWYLLVVSKTVQQSSLLRSYIVLS